MKRGVFTGSILLFVISAGTAGLYAAPGKKAEKQKQEVKKPLPEKKAASSSEKKKAPRAPGGEFSESDFKPKKVEDSYAWDIIKTILILAILVGAFYYFFRFVTKKAGIQVMGEDVIKTLAVTPVGQNRHIQVVDLAGKILVLGVAEGSISLITEVTDRDEINRIRLLGSKAAPAPAGGFQEYVSRQVGRVVDRLNERGSRKPSRREGRREFYSDDVEGDLDYLKLQKDRLKNLNGESHE